MTQSELNRAVAAATGETVYTISELGFSIADPTSVDYDPEPSNVEERIIDWDAIDARRSMPLVPVLA